MGASTMALVNTSNSLRAPNFTDDVHPRSSSRALNFNPLNSATPSTIYGVRSKFAGAEYCLSAKVERHGFSRGMWPPSRVLEGRERGCNVRLNAGSTPDSQTTDKEVDSSSSQGPSVQSHFDLLQQLTSDSALGSTGSRKTIAQQLQEDLESEGPEEVTIPLGSGKLDIQATDLTVSQKRNIARQKYMDKVSKRNDAPFFTAVALFVLVPPVAILGVAVATGYVDLFP